MSRIGVFGIFPEDITKTGPCACNVAELHDCVGEAGAGIEAVAVISQNRPEGSGCQLELACAVEAPPGPNTSIGVMGSPSGGFSLQCAVFSRARSRNAGNRAKNDYVNKS
jgi:hypothetical protein